jgi:hypothetical protein
MEKTTSSVRALLSHRSCKTLRHLGRIFLFYFDPSLERINFYSHVFWQSGKPSCPIIIFNATRCENRI